MITILRKISDRAIIIVTDFILKILAKEKKRGRKIRRGAWSREKCMNRYIYGEFVDEPDGYGDEITSRQLAKISKRSASMIGKWSSEDNWVKQREQNRSIIRAETNKKLIDQQSDRNVNQLLQLSEEHAELFRTLRKANHVFLQSMAQDVTFTDKGKQKKPTEISTAVQKKGYSLTLMRLANVAINAAKMERVIAGSKYLDKNVAIEHLEQQGYTVLPPVIDIEDDMVFIEE